MSNLDIFKIGIGPSSSHTLGPMLAANVFCDKIAILLSCITRVQITLFGSLSLTGKGHLSDKAVIWGLSGLKAKLITTELQEKILLNALEHNKLMLCGQKEIMFEYDKDIIFSKEFLPLHPNALSFHAFDINDALIAKETYYSIGGGFVKDEHEMSAQTILQTDDIKLVFNNAKSILEFSQKTQQNLAEISLEYELQFHSHNDIKNYCLEIWEVMNDSYIQGCNPSKPNLPGPLKLHRRAKGMFERIRPTTDPFGIIDYISLYAIAIAEHNAGGGRVVTAPTNGACAVIPAVILYLLNHTVGFNEECIINFLLASMLIGSLYKKNASISGAEAGCQAEIGSASSMAAGAMACVLGGDVMRACNAAEIAMEHHLGLTCDPAFGLVQIPCIERNAFGAIKAISAARMALMRKSMPTVSLDAVIETMLQTGKDMSTKYKETALGGLASTLSKTVC